MNSIIFPFVVTWSIVNIPKKKYETTVNAESKEKAEIWFKGIFKQRKIRIVSVIKKEPLELNET